MRRAGRERSGLSALPNPFLFNRPMPIHGLGLPPIPGLVYFAGGAASSPEDVMPNLFGDYEAHPLVKYMRAVMPASFNAPPSSAFMDQVKLAMLAMEYQGQPVELLKVAARSAAAALADTFTASVQDPGTRASLFNINAEVGYQNLIPVAEAVAAIQKPQMKLNLGPVGAQIVACVKGGGTWTKSGCASSRVGTRAPSSAPAPVVPASPSTSHLGLYLGIGAAVAAVGAVGYMALRSK